MECPKCSKRLVKKRVFGEKSGGETAQEAAARNYFYWCGSCRENFMPHEVE